MDGAAFVLADALTKLQEDDLDMDDEVLVDAQDAQTQLASVTRVVDAVAHSCTAVQDTATFTYAQSCIKHVGHLEPDTAHRLLDAILSGFSGLLEELAEAEASAASALAEPLERYAFLLQWLVQLLEKHKDHFSRPKTSARTPRPETTWTWASSLPTVLGVLAKALRTVSERLWSSAAMRDTFVSRCILRPVMLLQENEAYLKVASIKLGLFKVTCLAVKLHGQAFNVQTSIMQSLQYYEHLAEPMAELLSVLRVEFDVQRLGEDVLRELAGKSFTSLDTKSPRSYGRFLVRMAELNPRSVLKQISLLQKHQDSESYPMRNAMIEVHGLLLKDLALHPDLGATDVPADGDNDDDDDAPAYRKQINAFFERLLERFLDVTTFVRTRAIQVCNSLCDLPAAFPPQRLRMTELAVQALEDKSSHVRRHAILLLVKLILTHPYGALYGGELSFDAWSERHAAVQARLEQAEATLTRPLTDEDVPTSETDADLAPPAMSSADQEQLVQLRLTHTYCTDALQFMACLERGVPILVQLLASTNKAEVLASMEFFRVAYEYKIRGAADGVRAMIHLIWTKDHALVMDDGSQLKGVRSRLIEVYRALYFEPQEGVSLAENTARIARNMIERTFGATLAELTSLEQLLSVMHGEGLVDRAVIDTLWDVYATTRPIARAQRRGAIMVLSMLAKADRGIVADHIDTLLRMGLGPLGAKDLLLAQHTCIALQRVSGSAKKVKGALSDTNVRYPMSHPMFARLRAVVAMPGEATGCDAAWFGVAEHAIEAIYLLGEQPDALCTELVRHCTLHAFSGASHAAYSLAQALFVAGHVALKQIVYLELVERECKRRKAQKEAGADAKPVSELDQVAEQAEDDLGELFALIRDRELLYGPQSLLALYGPLVTYLCSTMRQQSYAPLRRAAALTLCKFMCISSEYCEANLGLLLHLLRASQDEVVRANAVIGLGDVAVCFGTLVDENSGRLYAGLGDPDLGVKKNTLMVLTHLILNGMIKVKGQLGELAKCLEDEEPRVSDLAKLFFSELAMKENAVYNNLPDIISHLSSGAHAVDEATFVNTMRFIFTFIDKERQAENVIEKLCQRFRLTAEERQWRDIAYCLSLLPYRSERSIKKLLEGLPYYQDKLYVPDVHQRFTDILTKMRQGKAAALAKSGETDLRELEDVLAQAAEPSEAVAHVDTKAPADSQPSTQDEAQTDPLPEAKPERRRPRRRVAT
ncbi:condensin complex non-SMC subunit Cnd1 [Malassezia equina]|uniref:Condensin complex subunit 1 n=1 Tax=Malassezia equina TaxID=1381935 RepID=A0AAF0EFS4_9BASI|nr:condensin complex non-SMC subunit Cnd1 [Malassezia equina]